MPLPRPAALTARLETPIEEWPHLDGDVLLKTRSRKVLHFQPLRYDRWSQALEVTLGLIPGEPAPLLKRRRELTRDPLRPPRA